MPLPLPRTRLYQRDLAGPHIADVAGQVRSQIEGMDFVADLRSGQTVALAVGSRGIANLFEIVRSAVQTLQSLGANVELVAAMGSHGGGTAEGQARVLANYGLSEERLGVPVRSSMETEVVGESSLGFPVHISTEALRFDHLLLINRIKPHTNFAGPIESGMHKMLLIGLGKREGAEVYHRAMQTISFPEVLNDVAARVLDLSPCRGGLAVLENALEETADVVGLNAADFAEREPELLRRATGLMPGLPFPECDLLIVDQIGKNISGSGMDTNVIGRKYNDHRGTDRDNARCLRIFARDLTDQTEGNAYGIGLAEFTTRRLIEKVNWDYTYTNVLTAGHPTAGMQPIIFDTDREALDAALGTIGLTAREDARVIHIPNTLHLSEFALSEAFEAESAARSDLAPLTDFAPMPVDADGLLTSIADQRNAIPS